METQIEMKLITHTGVEHYRCQQIMKNGEQCRHPINTYFWEHYGYRKCAHHSKNGASYWAKKS